MLCGFDVPNTGIIVTYIQLIHIIIILTNTNAICIVFEIRIEIYQHTSYAWNCNLLHVK